MAELIERTWQPQGVDGLPRRDRTGCDYLAYVPDPLADREFSLAGTTAADVADAEAVGHSPQRLRQPERLSAAAAGASPRPRRRAARPAAGTHGRPRGRRLPAPAPPACPASYEA